MVGWGFAFGRGIVILFWSIVWGIVAGIIAVVITGGSLLTIASNPTAAISNPISLFAGLFLGIFLSVFIAVVGFYASIVKVTVDGTIGQLQRRGLIGSASYMTGSLGTQPTLTVAPAQRLCQNCGRIVAVGSLKCANCGASV